MPSDSDSESEETEASTWIFLRLGVFEGGDLLMAKGS